ncbi:MAG: hypothetical protein V3T13_02460, partial [Hyphomicrobium sp.]
MKLSRREALLASGVALVGAAVTTRGAQAQTAHGHAGHAMRGGGAEHGGHGVHGAAKLDTPKPDPLAKFPIPKANDYYARTIAPGTVVPPGEPGKDYTPVVTPNGASAPFKVIDGVKVYHLTA